MNTTAPLAAADQIHILHTGVIIPRRKLAPDDFAGAMAARPYESKHGDTLVLTADLLEANPWIEETVDDPDEQLRRFGHIRIGRGAWPEDRSPWIPGAADTELERERRLAIANAEVDDTVRVHLMKTIRAEFGGRPTSTTLSVLAGSDGRLPEGF